MVICEWWWTVGIEWSLNGSKLSLWLLPCRTFQFPVMHFMLGPISSFVYYMSKFLLWLNNPLGKAFLFSIVYLVKQMFYVNLCVCDNLSSMSVWLFEKVLDFFSFFQIAFAFKDKAFISNIQHFFIVFLLHLYMCDHLNGPKDLMPSKSWSL